MKIKQIIAIIFMLILTISGTIFVLTSSAVMLINTDKLVKIMDNTEYFESSSKEAETVFKNYLPESKAKQVISNIDIKQNILDITGAINNNTVEQVSNKVKQNVKDEVVSVLDKSIDKTTKENFATTVSDAYVSKVLPVKEFSVLGKVYSLYMNKLKDIVLVLGIVSFASLLICVLMSKRTIKWALVALYNIIIFSIVVVIVINMLNGISIGNARFTTLLTAMMNKYNTYIIIYALIMVALSIGLNFLAYFKINNKKVDK